MVCFKICCKVNILQAKAQRKQGHLGHQNKRLNDCLSFQKLREKNPLVAINLKLTLKMQLPNIAKTSIGLIMNVIMQEISIIWQGYFITEIIVETVYLI